MFMLRNIAKFSIIPQRSKRFFTLSIQLNSQLPVSQSMKQEYIQHLRQYETKGAVLFAGAANNSLHEYTLLFQSANEVQPFQFVKKSPFHIHNLIATYRIRQIELQQKMRDKQLAPKYLRE